MPTEEELKRVLEIARSSKGRESEANWILEKYGALQLQLIAIAGATFSIYFALKTTPPPTLTKWGFILLAASLVLGLLSVIFAIMHRWWEFGVEYFKAEMYIYDPKRSEGFKKILSSLGRSEPPDYFNQLNQHPTLENMEYGTRVGSLIFGSIPLYVSSWAGMGQLVSFLFASVLLLLSLLCGF